MANDTPTPGPFEFSADEESAMRQSSAANRIASGDIGGDNGTSYTRTPKYYALMNGRSNYNDDRTDEQ